MGRDDASDDHDERARSVRHTMPEIVRPHDEKAGPVTAVSSVLIHFSLSQLREHGLYERYRRHIAPEVLDELLGLLAPAWVPVELAVAHYGACEQLELPAAEILEIGGTIGARIQHTLLVSPAKEAPVTPPGWSLWDHVGPLNRVWARVYRGGSVAMIKLGPKCALLEQRGFPMNRFAYFRQAQVKAIAASYTAIGTRLSSLRIADYSPSRDELRFKLTWL